MTMNAQKLVLSEDVKNELRQLWNVPGNDSSETSPITVEKAVENSTSGTGWYKINPDQFRKTIVYE